MGSVVLSSFLNACPAKIIPRVIPQKLLSIQLDQQPISNHKIVLL